MKNIKNTLSDFIWQMTLNENFSKAVKPLCCPCRRIYSIFMWV